MSSYKRADLVFGLVGALGTDFEELYSSLAKLARGFGYDAVEIRLSQLLNHVEIGVPLEDQAEDRRLDSYMNAGDRLREIFGRGDAVGILGIGELVRRCNGRGVGNTVYVLRSLKHPAESPCYAMSIATLSSLSACTPPKMSGAEYLKAKESRRLQPSG